MKTTLSAAVLLGLVSVAAAEKPTTSEIRASASELTGTYALNEARFDEDYTDKIVVVTGNVKAVRKTTHHRYTVQLETFLDVNIILFVDAKHRKELAAYVPGDEVTLRGKCIGAVYPESNGRRTPEIQLLSSEPLARKPQSELEPPPKPTF